MYINKIIFLILSITASDNNGEKDAVEKVVHLLMKNNLKKTQLKKSKHMSGHQMLRLMSQAII